MVKITLTDWHSQCGDGCCDDYGVYLSVNGKRLEHPYLYNRYRIFQDFDVGIALEAVLKELGHEVEIEHDSEY